MIDLEGKKLLAFAILGIVLIGLTSATLVPFLSNLVTGSLKVNSPLTLAIKAIEGGSWESGSDAFDIGDFNAGEDIPFRLKVTNNVNETIETVLLIIVDGDPEGEGERNPNCEDFTNVIIVGNTIDYDGVLNEGNFMNCSDDFSNMAVVSIDGVYLPNEVEEYEIRLTTALNFEPHDNYKIYFVEAENYEDATAGGGIWE